MALFVAILIFLAVESSCKFEFKCQDLVTCSCGNEGKTVRICASKGSIHAEMCSRLSNCETCEEGSTVCSTCPEGFEGPFCDAEKSKIRRKRQFALPDRGPSRSRPGSISTEGARSCPMLDSSNLGSINCVKISEEEICTGKCWADYHFTMMDLQDEMNLTCRGGIWRPFESFPKCTKNPVKEVIYCPDPGISANSVRQNTTPFVNSRFPQGSRLDYFCVQGYELEGERSIFCMPSGEWSATRPTCNAQSSTTGIPDADTVFCPDPEYNPNSVRWPRTPPNRQGFPPGSELVFSCAEGYDLKGESNLICRISGEWTTNQPRCVVKSSTTSIDLTFCRDPGKDENSIQLPSTTPNLRGFPPGSRLEYSCVPGYELQGEKTLFCLTSGDWTKSRPRCFRHPATSLSSGTTSSGTPCSFLKYCPDPGINTNSSRWPSTLRTSRGYIQGTQLEYSCDHGYKLRGERNLFCLVSGNWTASRPRCEIDERQEKTGCDKGDLKLCTDRGGGHKCMHYTCPLNYVRRTDYINMCKNVIQECPYYDLECFNEPKQFTYSCTTLNSNKIIPKAGQVALYRTTPNPSDGELVLQLKNVKAPIGVTPATRDNFRMRKDGESQVVDLIKSVQGPQEIELNVFRKTFGNGTFLGYKLDKYFLFVTEF